MAASSQEVLTDAVAKFIIFTTDQVVSPTFLSVWQVAENLRSFWSLPQSECLVVPLSVPKLIVTSKKISNLLDKLNVLNSRGTESKQTNLVGA